MVLAMKKIILVGIGIVLIYIASIYIRGYIWANQAAHYMTDSLHAFSKPWRGKEIYDRASPSLQANTLEKLEERSRITSIVLGDFVNIQSGPDCRLWTGISSYSKTENIYATCTAVVRFEHKTSKVNVVLVDKANAWWMSYDDWQINDFTVE